jgi:hypothetical protein
MLMLLPVRFPGGTGEWPALGFGHAPEREASISRDDTTVQSRPGTIKSIAAKLSGPLFSPLSGFAA